VSAVNVGHEVQGQIGVAVRLQSFGNHDGAAKQALLSRPF
jgi:hypothetical protein